MICGKCGNNCGDKEVFCGNCGARLAPAPEQQAAAAGQQAQQFQQQAQPQYQAPFQQQGQPYYQAPAGQAQPQYQYPPQQGANGGFYAAGNPAPTEKKKKSGKKAVLITVSIVLALALIAGAILFVPKLFRSDEGKFKDIERTELSDVSDGISSILNEIVPKNDGSSMTTKLNISIDESVLSLLAQAGDFSWLSEIGVEFGRATSDDATAGNVVLSIGGKDVLTADVKTDKAAGLIYLKIPELSDKYISFDSSVFERFTSFAEPDYYGFGYNSYSGSGAVYGNILDLDDFGIDTDEAAEAIQAITAALPDSDTLSGLIEKYGKIVIDSVEKTTEEETTLELGGISQKCTSLRVDFDENQLKDTAKAVLEEVKNDKDIKDIVTKFAEAEAARYGGFDDDWDYDDWDLDDYDTYGDDDWDLDDDDLDDWDYDTDDWDEDDWGDDYDSEDAYDMFIESIDNVLKELDETERSDNPRTIFDYTVFSDSSDNVIGRDFVFYQDEDTEAFNYTSRMLEGSDKVALEINVEKDGESLIRFDGSGSGSTDSYTGDGLLKANVNGEDVELVKADFKEFSLDDVRKGKLNGHISISFCEDLIDKIGSSRGNDMTASVITSLLGQLTFDLDFDNSGKILDFDAAVSASGTKLINVECRNEEGAKLDTRIPDRSDVVEYDEYDEESILEWVRDWDLDSFVDGLEDAGVPSEYCKMIKENLGEAVEGDDNDDWDDWDGWDYDDAETADTDD